MKESLLLFQEAAKKLTSICGGRGDIYCMVTSAAKDSENQVLYPIYFPNLMSALQRSNWGSSITCSVISDAASVVRKLSVRNDNNARIKNRKIPPQRNFNNIQLPAWLSNSATSPAPARSVLPLSHQPTYIFAVMK